MRGFLRFAAGLAAGTVAMLYYLDKQSGARRRALVRDRFVAAGHDAAGIAEAAVKRASDYAKGIIATRRLCVDLPQIAPLFPRFGGLDCEPGRELVGIGIELA